MIKTLTHRIILISLLFVGFIPLNSQILQEEQYLEGIWKFSIGDKEDWKNIDFDDSEWSSIQVPASWESQGFKEYNGFAWYRRTIRLDILPQQDLVLKIGNIDDADEVFINGRFVGRSGGMPPHIKTAYNTERMYVIPKSYWQKGKNTIAIRVYDFYNDGGILSGPVKLYSNQTDGILSLNLSGPWKFATHNQSGAERPNYNDAEWNTIQVPSFWENEGWEGFDGIAWYRKQFELPSKLAKEELILILGKIDDEDKTWFNGTRIGGVSPNNLRSSLARGFDSSYQSYSTIRAYKIPNSIINPGINTIAVRVIDSGIDGGIYEGPIGIMTVEQFKKFTELVRKEPGIMEQLWNWLNK